MGHMIETIALNKKIEVVTIDPLHPEADYKSLEESSKVDVFIDFTSPNIIMNNIKFYCNNMSNVVIGTTG